MKDEPCQRSAAGHRLKLNPRGSKNAAFAQKGKKKKKNGSRAETGRQRTPQVMRAQACVRNYSLNADLDHAHQRSVSRNSKRATLKNNDK